MKILGILLLLLVLIINTSVTAQWEPLTGPYSVRSYALAQLDDKLFIGADEGIFVTDNDGNEWNHITFTPNDYHAFCCLTTSSSFIVASRSGFVKISYDYGATWQDITFGLSNPFPDILLANDNMIITRTNDIFLKEKINGSWGIWKDIWNVSPLLYPTSIGFNNNSILFISNTNKIYSSTDKGENWGTIPFDSTIAFYKIVSFDNNFYLCTYKGLFKSTDSGITWTNYLDNYFIKDVYVKNSTIVVSAADNNFDGLLISSDNGNTWLNTSNNYYDSSISNLFIKDNLIFIATQIGGIFRSSDLGQNWKPCNKNLVPVGVNSFLIDNEKIILSNDMIGVFNSSNNGLTWSHNSVPLISDIISKSNSIFGIGLINGNSYYSTNFGTDWITLPYGGQSLSTVSVDNYLYSVNYYISKWNEITPSTIFSNAPEFLNNIDVMKNGINNILVVGTEYGEIYISEDLGNSWINRSDGLPVYMSKVFDISTNDNCIYAAIHSNSLDSTGVFRSTDFGLTWNCILKEKYIDKIYSKDNYFFAAAASFNGGIYASNNKGDSFTPFNEGLGVFDEYLIEQFQIINDYFYIGVNSDFLIKSNS